jgi:hypothetical protein
MLRKIEQILHRSLKMKITRMDEPNRFFTHSTLPGVDKSLFRKGMDSSLLAIV